MQQEIIYHYIDEEGQQWNRGIIFWQILAASSKQRQKQK